MIDYISLANKWRSYCERLGGLDWERTRSNASEVENSLDALQDEGFSSQERHKIVELGLNGYGDKGIQGLLDERALESAARAASETVAAWDEVNRLHTLQLDYAKSLQLKGAARRAVSKKDLFRFTSALQRLRLVTNNQPRSTN